MLPHSTSTSSTSSRTTTASSPHPGLLTTRTLAASVWRSHTPTLQARSARSTASRWTPLEATSTSTRLGSPAWMAALRSTRARSRLPLRRSTCRSAAAQGSRPCLHLDVFAGQADLHRELRTVGVRVCTWGCDWQAQGTISTSPRALTATNVLLLLQRRRRNHIQ